MRTLSVSDVMQVSGGHQHNFYDSIMVGGALSSVFSLAGAVGAFFWYLDAANRTLPLTTIFASAGGSALVTFPIAIFAGIGFGGAIGAIVGMGLYYSDIVTKPE